MTSLELLSLDPSLRAGASIVATFDDLPVEFRLPNDDGPSKHSSTRVGGSIAAGTEALQVQILGHPDGSLTLRLLSETDVFFHYARTLTHSGFAALQEQQQLLADLDSLPAMLLDLFEQCKAGQQIRCCFVLTSDSTANFDIISNAHSFRIVELFSLKMDRAPEAETQLLISFRYNGLRARLNSAVSKMDDLVTAVRHRHPQLLDDIEQELFGVDE
ncbi:hypothetical protein M885DRAFT_617571 [Pelagophyceae sp. CCMP2097]|nr:hypothetical protein M885DRAFT_617571 [Pelagophyceae sp. CCMP2097]|mmetsp:Transcript_15315/g.51515  ORF Transcript_15315/g.51515 Transcript_15315/m.51515 type:complete len:216 (+) Transcript_15315:142-789(+)